MKEGKVFDSKNAKFGHRVLAMLALALAASIGGSTAQAAPVIVSKPQVQVDSCSEEKCSIIQELEYSGDGKSAFGYMVQQQWKGDDFIQNYVLFKFDLATKRKTVLASLPTVYGGGSNVVVGQTVSSLKIQNVRPSNDGKYLFYLETKESQTVDSIDPERGPQFKNFVRTYSLKLRTLSSGKTELLNTLFGLKKSQPFHVTWAANSKSLSMLSQSNESGLQLSILTLATKKLTKGSYDNAPGFLSRNGKFASIGIWWLGEQKFQVVATRKTTDIEGPIYGPVVLFNDGIHMIGAVQGSGLTIFTTTGKKKVIAPPSKYGQNIRWYSLSPDQKTLMFVYNATDGNDWTNGYSLLKVELPD